MLRVSEKTARRLIAQGRLPAIQLRGHGSTVRIDGEQLHDWLNSRRTVRGSEPPSHAHGPDNPACLPRRESTWPDERGAL
jgi:excisionase family DNA binding protein